MAWPFDAIFKAFVFQTPIPYEVLNEVQERIVDLHRDKTQVFWPGTFENEGAGVDADELSWCAAASLNPEMTCLADDRDLWVPISLPRGAVIKQIDVKVYVLAATGLYVRLDRQDCQFDNSTTQPTFSNIEAPAAPGSSGWHTVSMPGLSYTVAGDDMYLVRIGGASAGDRCSGAQVTYQPITPTPGE
jgi:hypothetical protein